VCYIIHMKRTNLVLDEQLLEEAVRLGGARTYSQAVNEALAEYTRRIKARKILQLADPVSGGGPGQHARRPASTTPAAGGDPWSSLILPFGSRCSQSPRITLESYLELEEAVTCLPVIQEVLQGFSNQRHSR